jgi:phosphoglycolate phosphatase-like HAD superfamily hydrolase
MAPCAVFDVDGTLVDSNYQHVLAWHRAFTRYDVAQPLWQIHRHLGMGGDKLVAAVAGDAVEQAEGDAIRDAWKAEFDRLIDEVVAVPGAAPLLAAAKDAGATLVLASSGKPDHVDRFLDVLGARDLADAWTSSEDVDDTKPDPDLLEVAIRKVSGTGSAMAAVTFGDATWDAQAAGRLGLPAVLVRTGGFGTDELHAAGAVEVFDSLEDVRSDLDRLLALATPMRAAGS